MFKKKRPLLFVRGRYERPLSVARYILRWFVTMTLESSPKGPAFCFLNYSRTTRIALPHQSAAFDGVIVQSVALFSSVVNFFESRFGVRPTCRKMFFGSGF